MNLELARSPFFAALARAVSAVLMLGCTTGFPAERVGQVRQPAPSRAWLAMLPDGPTKRQFIIDCTGCHQFDEVRAMTSGRPKTQAEWAEAIRRMLSFAGPN